MTYFVSRIGAPKVNNFFANPGWKGDTVVLRNTRVKICDNVKAEISVAVVKNQNSRPAPDPVDQSASKILVLPRKMLKKDGFVTSRENFH